MQSSKSVCFQMTDAVLLRSMRSQSEALRCYFPSLIDSEAKVEEYVVVGQSFVISYLLN